MLQPEHMLVSTDFSDHAQRALQIGTSLSKALEIQKTSAIHVYNDATKYVRETVETSFDVGQLLQKRAAVNEKLQNYLRVKLDEHVREANADVEVQQTVIPIASGTNRSEALVQWVKDSDVDFIILGAKGQSAAEAFFLKLT